MTNPIKAQPLLRFSLQKGILNLNAGKDLQRSAGLVTLPLDKVYYKDLKILNHLPSVIS